MEIELIAKILGGISATGVFGAIGKLMHAKIKANKKETDRREKDREDFKELVEKVNSISVDVKGIKAKIKGLDEIQRNMLNAQGVAFLEWDSKGLCTYASPAFQMLIGQPDQKIKGSGWITLLSEEDQERIFKAWVFSYQNLTVFDEIYSFKTVFGKHLKVHALAFHNKDENGNYNGSFGQIKPFEGN